MLVSISLLPRVESAQLNKRSAPKVQMVSERGNQVKITVHRDVVLPGVALPEKVGGWFVGKT